MNSSEGHHEGDNNSQYRERERYSQYRHDAPAHKALASLNGTQDSRAKAARRRFRFADLGSAPFKFNCRPADLVFRYQFLLLAWDRGAAQNLIRCRSSQDRPFHVDVASVGIYSLRLCDQRARAGRIVHCSSVAALGQIGDGTLPDDNAPINEADFVGVYKRSKFRAERAVATPIAMRGTAWVSPCLVPRAGRHLG
jgi:hypothetical protein